MNTTINKAEFMNTCIQDILEKINWSNEQIKQLEQNVPLKTEQPAVYRNEFRNFSTLRKQFLNQLNEILAQYNLQAKALASAA